MVLHHQILFSLAIAATAEAILMWTSAEQVPSLHRVAPRYMKVVSFSDFWLFMVISERDPEYREIADLVVSTEGRSAQAVVKEVMRHFESA